MTTRRTFLQTTATLAAGILATGTSYCTPANKRSFTISIKAGNVGVNLPMMELIDQAAAIGFEAISPDSGTLMKMSQGERKEMMDKMKEKGLAWGAGGLPMDFRKDQALFEEGLKALPDHAKAYQEAGVDRIGTWIMPTHPDLSYVPNFQQHTERLRQAASVLEDHGIRFGLEYVAPKTLMAARRFPFIRTMGEARELISGIGKSNVGLILDAFHWYCAEDTAEDILALKNADIVAVDLNDATAGRSRDEQIDGQRQLPLASGIIDLTSFMNALVKVGYDGPVRAEPFNQPLRDMDDKAALKATYDSIMQTVDLIE